MNNSQNEYMESAGNEPVRDNVPPQPIMQKSGNRKIVAIALTCSLLGGMVGAGIASIAPFGRSASSNVYEGDRIPVTIVTHKVDTNKILTAAELYAQNVNSTVGIATSISTNYWGMRTTKAASGSGFVYSDDGYILTNHHVISGANGVTVTMYDGTTYDAKIVGSDESNDIAVLKIEAENLVPVVLGDSDSVNVGDTVVAIGNPLGELTFSLTSGVVSALNREVTFSGGISMDLIQTDTAINSGNSGGALFNQYGEVIGITNAKYSSSSSGASIDNIGFAIPLNSVRGIVDSIIEKGYISKPYIGVVVSTVGEDLMAYGLPAGASVQQIAENSPAEKAGLNRNDIITKLGDTEITTHSQLVDLVGIASPGDELTLTVYRNGEYHIIKIIVGESIIDATQETSSSQSDSPFYNYGNGYSINPWGNYNR